MGRKNLKGLVSIEKDKNRIRLRWRYQYKRYSLNLFLYNKIGLISAKKIAVTIEHDLIAGKFDVTLNKYKPSNFLKPINQNPLFQYFEQWVKEYKNKDCDFNMDYYLIRNMLRRWDNIEAHQILKNLNKETFNARTYNKRLNTLKKFLTWLKKNKVIKENYLEDVERKKMPKTMNENKKPFTLEEITKILQAFKKDIFCPKSSRFKHSHYFAFVYFIFKTGVRNSEAIGLRVSHIKKEEKLIEISEVLARTLKGSHPSARIRKETKNGKIRLLPLTNDLFELIDPLLLNKKSDDLVFQSPKMMSIDDKMFQRRVFKPILKALGIKERSLYACRHTFGSRCIEFGYTPVMTAFLMGNNPETVLRCYTHQISLPEKLPDLI